MHVLLFHYHAMFFQNHDGKPPPDSIWLGFTSVTFFFLLSGFILSHNYGSSEFNATTVRRYVFARFSRIYPVYLLSLLVALPFLLKQIGGQPDWLRPLWAASAVIAPLGLHAWVPGAACALNCPSWSVSTELFFYVMFPLLLPLAMRRPGVFAGATALLWLVSSLEYIWLWQHAGDGKSIIASGIGRNKSTQLAMQFILYFPLGRLPEFMIGIVIYVFWSRNREKISAIVSLALFAVIATIILFFHGAIPEIMLHNGATAVAWAALIVAAANMRVGVLTHPASVFLGQASFSLYLLHGPIALSMFAVDTHLFGRALRDWPWTMATLTTLLSIVISSVVFAMFEEPCRRAMRKRFSAGHGNPKLQAGKSPRA